MRKLFMMSAVILLLSGQAFAKTSHVNYKATFGIFGTVGTIKNVLTRDSAHYTIETDVRLAGMAKMIMGGQKEHYVSKGHIENGLMVSDSYTMTSTKKDQKKLKEYRIDHKRKHVTKRYRKWKHGKLIRDEKQTLAFYAKDDLLTLYFNMNNAIDKKGKVYHFNAVGLEKQKGKVQVTVPTDSQSKSYRKDLGSTADWYAKALIVQENFRKNQGDILLSVDQDGFIKKAVIKDILLHGDASLIRTK